MTPHRPAGGARAAPFLALALAGCHFGPFYDIYERRTGPDVAALSAAASRTIVAGETTLAEALELLGPPTRIERRRDVLTLTWLRRTSNRHWFGIGIGMAGFNLPIVDNDTVAEPEQRLVLRVENERVVGFGSTVTGVDAGAGG